MSWMIWVIALAGFFIGALILQGLRRVPADPPHKAVLTRFGKRTGEVKDEGWRFFLGFPFVTGAILVDMTRKNRDLSPEDVRTPDMAEIKVGISITWKPNPKQLIEYLNSGSEAGANNILSAVVEAAIREFAANPGESPFTWEEAVKMRDQFLAKIVASIIGDEGEPATLKRIATELRQGNSSLEIPNLGVILSRLNVTSIKPTGELAHAAELQAKERREQLGETVELQHVAARVQELMGPPLNLSAERALEVVQTERGKVSKDVKEIKLSPEAITAILGGLRGGRP